MWITDNFACNHKSSFIYLKISSIQFLEKKIVIPELNRSKRPLVILSHYKKLKI